MGLASGLSKVEKKTPRPGLPKRTDYGMEDEESGLGGRGAARTSEALMRPGRAWATARAATTRMSIFWRAAIVSRRACDELYALRLNPGQIRAAHHMCYVNWEGIRWLERRATPRARRRVGL